MNQPGSLIVESYVRKISIAKNQQITSEWVVDQLKAITAKKHLHYGLHQQTTARGYNVPDEILAMLHLIRYGMQDLESKNDFKNWTNIDSVPKKAQEGDTDPIDPSWVVKYIINPIEYIISDVMFPRGSTIMWKYGSPDHNGDENKTRQSYSRMKTRLEEAIRHNLFRQFILVLKKYGPCPKLNVNSTKQFEYMHKMTLVRERNRILTITGTEPGWIELIFTHLPFIIENSFKCGHEYICSGFPEGNEILSGGWDMTKATNKVSADFSYNFKLLVPIVQAEKITSIVQYIDAVMYGEVPFPLDSRNILGKKKQGVGKEKTSKKKKTDGHESDTSASEASKATPRELIPHVQHLWRLLNTDEESDRNQLIEECSTIRELLKTMLSKADAARMDEPETRTTRSKKRKADDTA
jgi:hypothetical protein